MKLFAHEPYMGPDNKTIKVSFTDGLTFNVEPTEEGEPRLFRSRKYRHEPFRSQNHEKAAKATFDKMWGVGA